ncbi:MAG: PSD1 and planctomycete cytochrome C domain-containing protein [Opitutaceae bacterium]
MTSRTSSLFRSRLLVAATLAALLAAPLALTAAEEKITFNEHIRPILSDNCFSCHGSDEKHREAERRLDTPQGAYASYLDVRAFVPGNLAASDAWRRITTDDETEQMPPKKSHKPPLSTAQRDLIKRWIEQGAVYQKHWAYEPLVRPAVPKIETRDSKTENPVDAFVREKLAARGLAFAPEASREILLRRLTLDLTGLPPTVVELDAFLADTSPDAYARTVDRLLASPRYGEHFARTWLDAVRYADTHGLHFDNERSIWPYRDWVVRAFNDNLPFNQFTIEQLAGDLLPNPTPSQLVATGYTRNQLTTNEGGAIAEEMLARYSADRTDTTAAVWLGLTTNCASCHDHKFDPLKQRETYAFGAFFKGLADNVWDGNARIPGPSLVLAEAPARARLDAIATELPPLRAALSARAEALLASTPLPKKGPVSYEVVWAEDGDVPLPRAPADPRPALAGEWRAGPDVPLVGGTRALRLEGQVERAVNFSAGDVPLVLQKSARAFVSVYLDPANPPAALSLSFVTAGETKRMIWGDAKVFGETAAKDAIVVGSLPLPGAYFRLEIDAAAAGIAPAVGSTPASSFTGVRVAQSGGVAWWDRFGVASTSADAARDPLLSTDAWEKAFYNETLRNAANFPLDITWRIRLPGYFKSAEDRKILEGYFRDFVYAPLRGPLEAESLAARAVMAEQVHYEKKFPVTLIARELATPHPAHVLVRGQYNNLGEAVLPDTPAFLPPLKKSGARASRLDLARWLVAPENPLTPRVTVNRIWQQVFGLGLVRTPSDFGSQGDPPTHLALIDWLASEFIASGWDTKKMVRLLVMSQTYRQDSRATPALLELDPANRLLARGPRVRLDAEVIRDQALVLGGLLVPTIGGPPVRPYQPVNVWEPVGYPDSNTRSYTQDHGDALYRRSLYTFWKRTAPPPSMTTFDAPPRESFCPVRGRTNTPLQALALMNDVQQFEAARAFAERLLARDEPDAARLAFAFRSVTARTPSESERKLLAEALATQRAHFSADLDAAKKVIANGESKPSAALPPAELAAWTLLTNLLLNLDETIVRN